MNIAIEPTVAAPRLARLDAEEFEALRRYLFAIAYRLLGSASEAEDIVQDAYLRAHDAPAESIHSPKAYLATIVSRLCLDRLRSARAEREVYVGPWLPEPAPTDDLAPTPEEAAERRDEVSLAMLLLLERLTPDERAAYVLREAFEYPYDEIATTLGKSTAAVRQLAHRARERVAAGRPRFPATPEAQRRLAERFFLASRDGDLHALTEVLAADATAWIDGGAGTRAARRPIRGRDAVSRWLAGIMAKPFAGARATFFEVNGTIACLLWSGGHLACVATIEADAGRIQALRLVANPDKLAYLQRRLDPVTFLPCSPSPG